MYKIKIINNKIVNFESIPQDNLYIKCKNIFYKDIKTTLKSAFNIYKLNNNLTCKYSDKKANELFEIVFI